MENQHKHIKGYRDLSEEEIALMNKIKEKAAEVGELVGELNGFYGDTGGHAIDTRWVHIGQTDLQKGFMALVRAVAQPESF